MGQCTVEGCESKSRTKGLCNKHALRLRLTGTTDPGPKAHGTLEERFWRKVQKDEGCWEWKGSKNRFGYGQIQEGGAGSRHLLAHRISYELNYDSIPDGKVVMHKCDNRSCVNPDHLMLGTYAMNTADMDEKGRRRTVSPPGERNGKSVLTEQIVREIRASDEPHSVLARRYNVGANTVRGVRIGRTWKHVV